MIQIKISSIDNILFLMYFTMITLIHGFLFGMVALISYPQFIIPSIIFMGVTVIVYIFSLILWKEFCPHQWIVYHSERKKFIKFLQYIGINFYINFDEEKIIRFYPHSNFKFYISEIGQLRKYHISYGFNFNRLDNNIIYGISEDGITFRIKNINNINFILTSIG